MKIDITELTINEINSIENEMKNIGADTQLEFEGKKIILIASNLEDCILA